MDNQERQSQRLPWILVGVLATLLFLVFLFATGLLKFDSQEPKRKAVSAVVGLVATQLPMPDMVQTAATDGLQSAVLEKPTATKTRKPSAKPTSTPWIEVDPVIVWNSITDHFSILAKTYTSELDSRQSGKCLGAHVKLAFNKDDSNQIVFRDFCFYGSVDVVVPLDKKHFGLDNVQRIDEHHLKIIIPVAQTRPPHIEPQLTEEKYDNGPFRRVGNLFWDDLERVSHELRKTAETLANQALIDACYSAGCGKEAQREAGEELRKFLIANDPNIFDVFLGYEQLPADY